MYGTFKQHLTDELSAIRDSGLYKEEREITTAQGSHIGVPTSGQVRELAARQFVLGQRMQRVRRANHAALIRLYDPRVLFDKEANPGRRIHHAGNETERFRVDANRLALEVDRAGLSEAIEE